MSIVEIMAHVGKIVNVKLKNGFEIKGTLQTYSKAGLLMEQPGEMLYLKSFEVESIYPV